jgi:hypothetical protein
MLGGLVRMRQVVHEQPGLEERVLKDLQDRMSVLSLILAAPALSSGTYLLVFIQVLEVFPDLGLPVVPGHVFKAGSATEGPSQQGFNCSNSSSGNPPSPFAGRKTSNPCSNYRVDEVFLRYASRVRVGDNE